MDIVRLLDTLTVTRATLAEWAGVSVHTLDAWRKGHRHPSPKAVRRLLQHAERHAAKVQRVASRGVGR